MMGASVETRLDRDDFARWLTDFGQQIMAHHEALSDMDAASGDADHGSNMERGLSSLLVTMQQWNQTDTPGLFLKEVGLHIVSFVGGSSGALYGTIFLRMARAVGDAVTINDALLLAAFEGAVQGIVDRGKVRRGDKTMLDALGPATDALKAGLDIGTPLPKALSAAACAAEAGRDATADMVARRGKSSYARQKSLGFIDPGAASIALMIRAAARSLGPSTATAAQ